MPEAKFRTGLRWRLLPSLYNKMVLLTRLGYNPTWKPHQGKKSQLRAWQINNRLFGFLHSTSSLQIQTPSPPFGLLKTPFFKRISVCVAAGGGGVFKSSWSPEEGGGNHEAGDTGN